MASAAACSRPGSGVSSSSMKTRMSLSSASAMPRLRAATIPCTDSFTQRSLGPGNCSSRERMAAVASVLLLLMARISKGIGQACARIAATSFSRRSARL